MLNEPFALLALPFSLSYSWAAWRLLDSVSTFSAWPSTLAVYVAAARMKKRRPKSLTPAASPGRLSLPVS